MEEKIIEILGSNHTESIRFIDVTSYNEVYGLYTYRGEVCCLTRGLDVDFSGLPEEEQKTVLRLVESKNWIIDNTIQ